MVQIRKNYPEEYERTNVKDFIYFEISYKDLQECITAFENLSLEDITEIQNFKHRLIQKYHVIITFAVMTIEAFVNDYLAVCLTDDFFSANLDKLNINQKIEIMYALLWDEKLEKSECMFKYITELVRKRNSFVHAKSKQCNLVVLEENFFDETYNLDNYEKKEIKQELKKIYDIFISSLEAIKSIHLFFLEVDKYDKNRHAVASVMGCISSDIRNSIETLPEIVKKEINKMENKIKKIKKKNF